MTTKEYLQGLAKVVSALIGSQLSTTKGASGNVPSIYIARQNNPKPTYPYVICDYIGTGDIGNREAYRTFNGTSEVTCFNRSLRLRVALYGNYKDDILSIIENLRNKIYTNEGKSLLKQNMTNAGILGISEPSLNSNLITTDYEEFAFVVFDFWTVVELSDDSVTAINEIDYLGELYQDYEQDNNPLTINRVITNN